MWEQLFLFCLLLFDVKPEETGPESGSDEDICGRADESGTREILPVILNSRTNSSLISEAAGFEQIGFRYTGGSDARQGHSVMPSSHLEAFVTTKLRKVMSSLSQVNLKAVLLRMISNIEDIFSRMVLANPFLAAVNILVKQMMTSFESFGKGLVLQTEKVVGQTLQDINISRNEIVTDFIKSVTWVNHWWQALKSVFKSWLPSNDRQGRTSASHFLELSAFIRTFHWLRGEEREKAVLGSPSSICGYGWKDDQIMPQPRIMGGQLVRDKERFPWQLSLATSYFGFFYQHRCGAALISRQWVITAAHCIKQLGLSSLYIMGDFLEVEDKFETAQVRWVDKVVMHPKFVAALYEQDIALLHLEEELVFSASVLPICLPPPGADTGRFPYLGRLATLTGWGRHWDKGPLATGLEMVQLPLISNKQCMEWYNRSGSRQLIPQHTFLCAGWEEGAKDACGGDSGGPLVVYRPDGRAELVGIVSWGIGCGTKGRPGVYTRVSNFIAWIKEVTGEALI